MHVQGGLGGGRGRERERNICANIVVVHYITWQVLHIIEIIQKFVSTHLQHGGQRTYHASLLLMQIIVM